MAKGYVLTYKIDYEKTFASVAKMNTIYIYYLLLLISIDNYNSLIQKISFYIGNYKKKFKLIFFANLSMK